MLPSERREQVQDFEVPTATAGRAAAEEAAAAAAAAAGASEGAVGARPEAAEGLREGRGEHFREEATDSVAWDSMEGTAEALRDAMEERSDNICSTPLRISLPACSPCSSSARTLAARSFAAEESREVPASGMHEACNSPHR